MKTRTLPTFAVLAVLICVLFSAAHVLAARKTAGLEDHARTLGFSKTVPGQLNYQGYLADAADSSAVTGTLEMTFRLFDSETKGAELWSETHSAVDVNNGLFHVLLGSMTPFPPGLFDGTAMWLQTEVGTEILAPRKPLVSVAYSHRANSAETLLDLTLTDLDDRWVNEGQANSVTSDMIVDGAGSGLDADMVDGQHAADFISADDLDHLDASDGDPANAVYVDVAGEVGIGTTTPTRNLHVYEDTDGLVGIDIQNPNTGSSSMEMITFTDENGGVAGIATYDDGSIYPSAMRIYNNRPNGNIGLATGSLERVRINNDGKVGIGTTTPSYTLDVNGAVQATTYHGDGSNLTGIAGAPDADWTINGNDIYHEIGNVGIGTTGPTAPLTIHAVSGTDILFTSSGNNADIKAASEFRIGTSSAHNVHLLTNDTFRLTVTSGGGRVGIGTTMPTKLLDVAGSIQADTLSLGSYSKAGTDGALHLYRDGSADPIVDIGDYGIYGGKIHLVDDVGTVHTYFEPDVNGEGGFLDVMRNSTYEGFYVDGNYAGTEEPRVVIEGSALGVYFQMDQSGDASVVLPTDAVSAPEILDEPGVSNSLGQDYVYLDAGNIDYVIDTVAITIPGPGYVEVTGGCYLNMRHSNGTDTRVFVAIDKTPASASYTFPGATIACIPALIASSDWQFPATTTRLYEEASGGTKYYYLNADYQSGTSTNTNVARAYIRAKYYPTLYGTVTVAETEGLGDELTASQNPGDGLERTPEPRRRSITVQQHNARLEAKLATMRAELDALKQEVRNQRRH